MWPDGFDDDDVDDEFFPPLPQEDRLWRHPAEVAAAERAAAAVTTVTTMQTPWRQALTLGGAGAVVGAVVVAGLFFTIGSLRSPTAAPPVTQSVAASPILARPVVVDSADWPAAVGTQAMSAVAEVVATHEKTIHRGSAVAFRSDGLLLTSHNVVDGADSVVITLSDGSHHVGNVLGTDAVSGLAVVRIDHNDLALAPLGIFKPSPRVGQYTVLIGGGASPDQLAMSSLAGLSVTVPLTDTHGLHGMLQLDSGLPDGFAGGAVVDDSGAIIGIAVDVGTTNAAYAVPIAYARKVAEDLVVYGEARHAWIGIRGIDVSVDDQHGMGVVGGVEIVSVLDQSPADAGGLRRGDVILSLEHEEVLSMTDLIVTLRDHPPGRAIPMSYLRDGEIRSCELVLELRPVDD